MKLDSILVIAATVFLALSSCTTKKTLIEKSTALPTNKSNKEEQVTSNNNIAPSIIEIDKVNDALVVNDTTFVNLRDYSNDFVYDMKYATEDNFLHSKVYECEACYLRYKTVKSLLKANEKFMKKGYRIILYDCYRPLSIQKKMFEIVSNPKYVADPKKGSIHNRGGAVDISLVDSNGNELDMGTPFDFFGVEASHYYELLSDKQITNRKLLRKIMTQNNFKIFDSEWWHYNLKNAQKDPVSNFRWHCD